MIENQILDQIKKMIDNSTFFSRFSDPKIIVRIDDIIPLAEIVYADDESKMVELRSLSKTIKDVETIRESNKNAWTEWKNKIK